MPAMAMTRATLALSRPATASAPLRARRTAPTPVKQPVVGGKLQRITSIAPSAHRQSMTATTDHPASMKRGERLTTSAASSATPAAASGGDTGETAAIINVIKAIFGAGGFALPWAFAQGGTVLVTACLVSSYWFALKALEMLVKSQETLINAGKATQEEVQTYAGLTAKAIGPIGDVICRVLNVVTCFGITVGYMIFVADTCISMLPAAKAATYTTAKMLTYNLPVWLFMAWQRSIAGVNLISLFGTTTVALSMVWVAISALRNPMQAIPLADISQFSGFFGTVAFLFFIHFTLFSVQEGMPQKKYFLSAANKAFLIAMAISLVFGLVGAVGYGQGVSSVVVTMLTGVAGIIVKGLLALNLWSTFPLMARSSLLILENVASPGKEAALPLSLGIRTGFVALAAYLACNVPNFGAVLGLVGGVCCCAMSIFMPPIILYKSKELVGAPATGGEKGMIGFVALTGLVCMILSVVL